RSFRGLTRQQRAVVALHYQYGYTLDECAGLMGCRPGTARSHLARALQTPREEPGYERRETARGTAALLPGPGSRPPGPVRARRPSPQTESRRASPVPAA